jgi:glycosyltransferase involved in cell wall biosynthesis
MNQNMRYPKNVISIIVPVYNEEESIKIFHDEISKTLKEVINFEIIFVVDPSSDRTEFIIENLAENLPHVKMVLLSRRVGQVNATLCGFEFALGDAVVVMDVDLQDDPSILPTMVDLWSQGIKVVLAERKNRQGDNLIKLLLSKAGYIFFSIFSNPPIPKNVGNFRLLDKSVKIELLKYGESQPFLRGLFSLVGFESRTVYFDRVERNKGKTKYNKYLSGTKEVFDGIVGYTSILLKAFFFIGFGILGVTIITAIYFINKLVDENIENASIIFIYVLVLFSLSIIIVSLGILGLYIGRIYEQTLNRPRYHVARKINV